MTSIQAAVPTPVASGARSATPGRTANGSPATGGMRPDAFAQALGDAVAGDKPATAAPNEAPANPRETARLRRPAANDKKPETRPVAPPRDAARVNVADGADGAAAPSHGATAAAAQAKATAGSDRGDVQAGAAGPINATNGAATDAAALLAQLQRQSALQASPAGDAEGNITHSDDGASGGTGAARSTHALHAGPAALAAALLQRAGTPNTGAGAGASVGNFSTALAAAAAAAGAELQPAGFSHAQDSARIETASPLPLVATVLPATAVNTAVNTAPAAEAALQAHPASAGFGAELGAQITTFVRNGIEHARLLLNPAELGPVLLQIQVDGNTAVVHLCADLASTRQALEQALPDLAGSLREAGLTLTGGGVFQQPRPDGGAADAQGQPRNSGSRGTARESDTVAALDATHNAAAQRRRGVVDLIA
ncbi:MAG: flagellar hook-length control protein FliK [Rubrivivax sp.]|nr:flagellar hook-length control protein FliK [Rubrivivax sp.]